MARGFRHEIQFRNRERFFLEIGLYANYDSAPISQGGASSDYGVTSSIAYKF